MSVVAARARAIAAAVQPPPRSPWTTTAGDVEAALSALRALVPADAEDERAIGEAASAVAWAEQRLP